MSKFATTVATSTETTDESVHMRCFPGIKMGGRQGSVMSWATFLWEALCSPAHVDVTLTCTTYLNIIADQVHPFISVFHGFFQKDRICTTKMVSVQVLTWPLNSPKLSPINFFVMCSTNRFNVRRSHLITSRTYRIWC